MSDTSTFTAIGTHFDLCYNNIECRVRVCLLAPIGTDYHRQRHVFASTANCLGEWNVYNCTVCDKSLRHDYDDENIVKMTSNAGSCFPKVACFHIRCVPEITHVLENWVSGDEFMKNAPGHEVARLVQFLARPRLLIRTVAWNAGLPLENSSLLEP